MTRAPGPSRPDSPRYKGGDLDAERGPGLGCFYAQVVLLVALVVLTPASAFWHWPPLATAGLMVGLIVLLLLTGQTIIFLLRIVAADRGRRRPLASRTRTVGDIEAERGRGTPSTDPGPDERERGGGGEPPGVRE